LDRSEEQRTTIDAEANWYVDTTSISLGYEMMDNWSMETFLLAQKRAVLPMRTQSRSIFDGCEESLQMLKRRDCALSFVPVMEPDAKLIHTSSKT
jgi:hypothetical protein